MIGRKKPPSTPPPKLGSSEAVELLRRLSHDLRTPMTNVLGSTELLLESELDGGQRMAAETVHRAARDVLDVVDKLLASQHIEKSTPPSSHEFRAAPRVSALLSGRRVLLAEDNGFNRALIERVLMPMGCEIDMVSTGTEAVRVFRPGRYDLILMDCQMPELDGLAATREIRRAEQGKGHVPIVAVTASTISGTRRACIDAGMDDFLAKPFSLGRLRRKVLEWLLPSIESQPPEPDVERPAPAEARPPLVSEAVVDLSRLHELAQEAGTPEIVEELSKIFLEDVARRIVALGISSRARDQRTYLNVIHAIKGASGNFGAVRMARMAEASERQVKQGNWAESDETAAALGAELEVVREVLEQQVFSVAKGGAAPRAAS